jgi:hypothetical protein
MFFNLLNPFHWIRTILSIILVLILILIPGWSAIFAHKTLSEIGEMLSSNFWGTVGNAFSESFSYYKSWFQSEENQQKIEETKGKAIEIIEKKANEAKDEQGQ